MRVGGLATGMDIDGIVEDLMAAERIPLNKMEQDKVKLEWQIDAYREVNSLFLGLDNMTLDMKMRSTYTSKSTSSTSNAVSATASSSAPNGTYRIDVNQLATNEVNVSKENLDIDPKAPLSELGLGEIPNEIKFKTFHNGEQSPHSIEVEADDTLESILKKITDQDNGVRAFYDTNSGRVFMERTGTGSYNPDGSEIDFNVDDASSTFFTDILQLETVQEGKDAEYTYNGVSLTSKNNTATLNGITFNFQNETTGPALITVNNNVDGAMDKIMSFVDEYNEMIDTINAKLIEPVNRDYPPLTEQQRAEMTESEIELWEEKAKSGLLRNDTILNTALSEMRSAWYAPIDTEGAFSHVSDIGITTSSNFRDGGKLVVDEDKLRAALEEDADSVFRLFSNNSKDNSRGIIHRVDDAIDKATRNINDRAGRSTSQTQQFSLGRRLNEVNERITNFERRLQQVETRYWSQFSAMEQAIQRMNDQSNYMFQQFNQ